MEEKIIEKDLDNGILEVEGNENFVQGELNKFWEAQNER